MTPAFQALGGAPERIRMQVGLPERQVHGDPGQ